MANSLNPVWVTAGEDFDLDPRPVHIYYTHTSPVIEPEFAKELDSASRNIMIANSWHELINYLKYNPVSICVNARNFEGLSSLAEILNMIKTFANLTNNNSTNMTVTLGVNHDTPYKIVKEAQMCGILGIIPNNTCFGWRETLKGLLAQFNGQTHWSKDIINQLPGCQKKPLAVNKISLTPRQQQVFDIVVARGCSNKHVSKLLGLSESTIKLHLSAIFKKYGVKNRTQLAVFSKASN